MLCTIEKNYQFYWIPIVWNGTELVEITFWNYTFALEQRKIKISSSECIVWHIFIFTLTIRAWFSEHILVVSVNYIYTYYLWCAKTEMDFFVGITGNSSQPDIVTDVDGMMWVCVCMVEVTHGVLCFWWYCVVLCWVRRRTIVFSVCFEMTARPVYGWVSEMMQIFALPCL